MSAKIGQQRPEFFAPSSDNAEKIEAIERKKMNDPAGDATMNMATQPGPLEVRLSDQVGVWVPVAERMPPPGSVVLAAYRNRLGHWRRICAEWVPAKTPESDIESEFCEYDEATDTYYTPEGWYERIDNWDEYSSVKVSEGQPSHWMRLPPPPENA